MLLDQNLNNCFMFIGSLQLYILAYYHSQILIIRHFVNCLFLVIFRVLIVYHYMNVSRICE